MRGVVIEPCGNILEITDPYNEGEKTLHQVYNLSNKSYLGFDVDPGFDTETSTLWEVLHNEDYTVLVVGKVFDNPDLVKSSRFGDC